MEQLRGALTEGGMDSGDARTKSGMEEGLRWRKTDEVDAWVMGDECTALGHGRTRQTARGGENFWSASDGSILRGAAGRGPGGVGAAWRQSGREREGERGPWA
jgi:hypothetical protein